MKRLIMLILIIILLVVCSHVMVLSSELTAEEKQNKQVIELVFEEALNKQNFTVWDSALSADYVRYCDAMPPDMQVIKGIEKMKEFLTTHFVAFPDWNEEIIQMVIEDDKIAIVSVGTGTMTGKMGPFEPTGKKVKITDIMIHRFENGKIVETWVTWDNINFMTQAGLMPSAPAPPSDLDLR